MATWAVLITDGLEEGGQKILRSVCEVDDRKGISAEELLQLIGKYDALIVRSRTKVTAQVLAQAQKLKVIGRAGVGVDNIDLAAASARQITVVNAPQSTTIAVAEHTIALMAALARNLTQADASMKSGQWLKSQLMGSELYGKTLGLIGVGNIGTQVACRAAAFGMTVVGYDPYLSEEQIRERGARPVSLNELFALSDFISLHVPLSPETRNMLDGQAFAAMKRGVRIICTARGGVIDETALLQAIESGQVAGAALDVFAVEPPGLTALVAHPRVIATPHIAAQTVEAQARAAVDIAEEVLAALEGRALRWRVV
ncbi:MAG: hydroxyacid dehydrogenase [Anaerolineales bacterium]|nr:hydroxyacid dehydrogenase [Anaerolineales bacterium]MCS7248850.1 hydroxyacid dehydrogenase [Anaerolineales bacterium]MDW8162663.1 hydroxyacid dehydrogenase [Anaerolineales bacterium]MDW8445737.1 hydroxyacid dehydrogenase [Anaerolineales bacterium]